MQKSFIGSALIGHNRYYKIYRDNRRNADQMSLIFNHAKNRVNDLSYFDLLIANEIQDNPNIKKTLFHLQEHFIKTKHHIKQKLEKQIAQMVTQTQTLRNQMQQQVDSIKAMGFDITYNFHDAKDFDSYYIETAHHIKCVLPSEYSQNGYCITYIDFPSAINGLDPLSTLWELENPYMQPVIEFSNKFPTLQNDIINAKREIETLSKSKLSLLLNKEKRASLIQAKNALARHQLTANYLAKLQKRADDYSNLTEEQKDNIKCLLQNIKSINSIATICLDDILTVNTIDNNVGFGSIEQANYKNDYLIEQSKELLSEDEALALSEFINETAHKIVSLSDEQRKEIVSSSKHFINNLEFDGQALDKKVLYAISNTCCKEAMQVYDLKQSQSQTMQNSL